MKNKKILIFYGPDFFYCTVVMKQFSVITTVAMRDIFISIKKKWPLA